MSDPKAAVFLSYASQDSEAAAELTRALRAAGIEVWFDQSELRGGDAWDTSIRKQIRACTLFIPVISQNTHAREEGYFRLEWKLAVDRSHLMANSKTFLLPVVIDDTRDNDDRVPDRFREVQWTRLPEGRAPPAFIERVARLVAPVGSGNAEPAAPAAAAATGSSRGVSLGGAVPKPGARSAQVLLVLGAVAAIAFGYFEMHRSGDSTHRADAPIPAKSAAAAPPAPSAVSAIPEKSIAVLPFVDMSEKKDQEYFSDGLAEELLDLLAQIRDLHVAARTSSFSFRGKSEDIASIAQKLRVAHVLEGSVRKSGDVIRISAQLIRADNGYDLWSKTYDRPAKDIFKVQDEIAGAVVDALKLQLLPAQQIESRHRSTSTEAYTEYLLGNQDRELDTFDSNAKALIAYQKALALDPSYAAAYSGIADAEWRIADQSTNDPNAYARAIRAADKAIALAPESPEGYWARGQLRHYYYWNWSAAQSDYEKALALDPSFISAREGHALLLATQGRPNDAAAILRQLLTLDPLSIEIWRRLGILLLDIGQFRDARAAIQRMREINPNADDHGVVGFTQLREGHPADALATFEANPTRVKLQGVAMAEHTLQHKDASDRALAEFIKQRGVPFAYQIAQVYAWRGENDKAFEWLETAYRNHDGGLPYLTYDQMLDQIRGDARFGALLRKLKLAPTPAG